MGSDNLFDIKFVAPSLDFTPVSNLFIDNYLSDSRGDYIKVYLLCLRLAYSNSEISMEKLSQKLNLLHTDIMKAFEYWENVGLMRFSTDGVIQLTPLEKAILKDEGTPFDKRIKEMFDDIEILIGRPLSSKEVSTYLSWVEEYNFTPEIITLLVQYCTSKKKTDIRYIEKVALAWFDSGIKTLEDAQNYITKHEDKWNSYRTVLNFLGFKDTDISKPQEEYLEKWLFKYNFSIEIIKEAARICVSRINEINFSYIDAILNSWNKDGVKTLNDIKKPDKKVKQTKKAANNTFANYSGQREYDIKELERQLLGRGDINAK